MLRQIPIGYRIENGKAVIDVKEAELIRCVFRYYLEGMSLADGRVRRPSGSYSPATQGQVLRPKVPRC